MCLQKTSLYFTNKPEEHTIIFIKFDKHLLPKINTYLKTTDLNTGCPKNTSQRI